MSSSEAHLRDNPTPARRDGGGMSPNGFGRRMAIDATAKCAGEHGRGWPLRSRVSEEASRTVDEIWNSLGLG